MTVMRVGLIALWCRSARGRSVQVIGSENILRVGLAKRARFGVYFSGLTSNDGALAPYDFADCP